MKTQKEKELYYSPETDVIAMNSESMICQSPLEGVGEGSEHGWETMMPDGPAGLGGIF